MALHEHASIQRHFEFLTQVSHSLFLVLASAIREEAERYSLLLEEGKRFVCVRQRIIASDKYAVYTDNSEKPERPESLESVKRRLLEDKGKVRYLS